MILSHVNIIFFSYSRYKKHTNFGLQRFRIDYKGSRILIYNTPTVLDFKIPRYSELLYDTYFVINLPNIYSPFYHYLTEENETTKNGHEFAPYEFRWIEELGTNFIEEINVYSGGVSLAKYSGEYLNCLKERDFTETKKKLWDKMIGHTSIYNNPALKNNNTNMYPNAYKASDNPIEPSIRGDRLYIPLGSWFKTK